MSGPKPLMALSHRQLAGGLIAFSALAWAGLWTARWLDRGGAATATLSQPMPAGSLLVALALVVADFLLGGLRLHLWVRRLAPRARYALSVQVYLVNLAASAVSPLGLAAGPAQWAVLVRGGVGGADAVAALLLNFVGILTALVSLAGVGVAYVVLGSGPAGSLAGLERAGLLACAGLAGLLLVGLLNPRVGLAVAAGISRLGGSIAGRAGELLAAVGGRLERGVAEYRAALAAVRGGWPLRLAANVGISSLMLLDRCLIGFLVAVSLGFTGSYTEAAARQLLQALLLYFSPSPGGSGLAEATVPVCMAGVVPAGRSMEYALVWRVLTSYIGIAVGAMAATAAFGRRRAVAAAGA